MPIDPEPTNPEEPKDLSGRPPHRPLKFQTVAELEQKIEEYFASCEPHVEKRLVLRLKAHGGEQYHAWEEAITDKEPYTIHGLARALDTTRETLRDYESGKYDDRNMDVESQQSFSDTITRAKARIAEYAEKMLYVSGASHGAQFNLKNNYGWKDESEVTTRNVDEDLAALDDPVADRLDVAAQADKALNDEPAKPTTPQ